jgi:hypothetical protein
MNTRNSSASTLTDVRGVPIPDGLVVTDLNGSSFERGR